MQKIKLQVWEIKSAVRYKSNTESYKVKITRNRIAIVKEKVSETGFQTNAMHIKLQAQQILGVKLVFNTFINFKRSIYSWTLLNKTINWILPAFLRPEADIICALANQSGILRAGWIDACHRTSEICAEDKRTCAARF